MGLRGWMWDAAGLGDRPLLDALAAALPEATGTRERRLLLPTHLVVTLVVAMGLWAEARIMCDFPRTLPRSALPQPLIPPAIRVLWP